MNEVWMRKTRNDLEFWWGQTPVGNKLFEE
jgi:hypothetical protein